jgi:hypothetical protein
MNAGVLLRRLRQGTTRRPSTLLAACNRLTADASAGSDQRPRAPAAHEEGRRARAVPASALGVQRGAPMDVDAEAEIHGLARACMYVRTCGRYPMRAPLLRVTTPPLWLLWPAMIFSRVDLPARWMGVCVCWCVCVRCVCACVCVCVCVCVCLCVCMCLCVCHHWIQRLMQYTCNVQLTGEDVIMRAEHAMPLCRVEGCSAWCARATRRPSGRARRGKADKDAHTYAPRLTRAVWAHDGELVARAAQARGRAACTGWAQHVRDV